jgi:CRISPR-associated protein Cmr4
MEKKKTKVWLITAKTNLHVGDENTSSYGLIDKTVQRDVLTGLPNIHGSSLKGAINEYYTGLLKESTESRRAIFGSDKLNAEDSQKGGCDFFDARLLSIPVQSNNRLFYRATCPAVINDFIESLKLYGIVLKEFKLDELVEGIDKDAVVFTEDNTILGDFSSVKKNKTEDILQLEKIIGPDIAVFKDEKFKELCSDFNLPIIARNKVGENNNLWYEQLLPRETVFYTLIIERSADLDLEDRIIQIGANATVGYGQCKFDKLKFNSNE